MRIYRGPRGSGYWRVCVDANGRHYQYQVARSEDPGKWTVGPHPMGALGTTDDEEWKAVGSPERWPKFDTKRAAIEWLGSYFAPHGEEALTPRDPASKT